MITKGVAHHLRDLEALVAWNGNVRSGVATYRLDTNGEHFSDELISINATVEGGGVGSALLLAVEGAAVDAGLQRVWLITSNDNLDALRFYQKRGYRIAAVYQGAIDEARKLKPSIPTTGYFDIPIHDEIELEKVLQSVSA